MRSSSPRQGIAWALAAVLVFSSTASQVSAQAQMRIGGAQIVVNDVKGVVGANQPAPLRAGIDVFQNEIIRTGDRSASKVLFQDNTNLSVGAGSEVTLDRFVFDPNPANSQVALSIARGVVRFTTGSLPKSAYKISTPTATIGIRGTILTIYVAANGLTIISVEEGVALVTSGGQTVTVDAGMTTTVSLGAPPTPPGPTPPTPPAAITEMDRLIGGTGLAAGPPAGVAGAITLRTVGIIVGVGAIIAGAAVLASSSGGGNAAPAPAAGGATSASSATTP